MSQVHPLVRTTPRTRTEIKASAASLTVLAERYNIPVATARKWKSQDDAQDRSHRPHKLCNTLNPAQELLVVELRRTLLRPLDDLLTVVREFIKAVVSRSGLNRCLRRHGVSDLSALVPVVEGKSMPVKTFKDCEPGVLHIDIKYLPQVPMRPIGATSSWPSTAPRDGSSCAATAISPTSAVQTSCVGSSGLHR